MRAIWKGAVSFGLVNVPVRLYSATENHDASSSGAPRGRRTDQVQAHLSIDGEEVSYDDIAKGYQTEDGEWSCSPTRASPTCRESSKEIGVTKSLRPSGRPDVARQELLLRARQVRDKPYILLRDALVKEKRMAIVTGSSAPG